MILVDAWRAFRDEFDWVEELLYLVLLAAEACILYPWQFLIHALIGQKEMPFLGLCLLFWVPYLVASLLGRAKLALDRKQAIIAGLAILSALVAVRFQIYTEYPLWSIGWIAELADRFFDAFAQLPTDLIILILVFVGWWRGIALSRKEYDTQQVWYHFRVGIVVLFAYFLVTLLGQRADLSAVVLAYFFFGLLGIALARILELGGIHQSTLGSKQWVVVLVGVILGSLGLALLVSLLVSRRMIRAVLDWFSPLVNLVGRVLWILFSIVFYLLWPLIEVLTSWFKQAVNEGAFSSMAPFLSPLTSPLQIPEAKEVTDVMPVCRTVFVVAIVLGGLLLVARAIRRMAQERAKREDLERESLWSGQEFARDLRDSLRERWDQLRALASQFGGAHRRSAASIRKIYASMVDLATEAGYPRRLAETPYEYRTTLYQAFAGGESAVDAITEAYVRVHYGQVPDTREEMDQIVRYWREVQTLVARAAEGEEA